MDFFAVNNVLTPFVPDSSTPLISTDKVNNKKEGTAQATCIPSKILLEGLSAQLTETNETVVIIQQLDNGLSEAEALTKKAREEFNQEEQDIAAEVIDFVNGKTGTMFDELSTSENQEVERDYDGVPNAPDDRKTRIEKLLKFITNNEAQSTFGRYSCNVANATTRLVVSVLIPTLLRQELAYAIEWGLICVPEQYQTATRLTVAFIAASYPVILNVAGALADRFAYDTRMDTPMSNACRALNIVWGIGGICAAYALGELPSLAASLVAYNAYCFMRDVSQIVVRLDDIKECEFGPVAQAGGAYAINQFGVNSIMTNCASPSGASAAKLPYANVVGNDLGRATTNLGGELVDYFTFTGLHCLKSGEELRVQLNPPQIPKKEDFWQMMTGIHAARAHLFTQALLLGAVLATVTSLISSQSGQNAANDAITAGMLGLFYSVLVGTATRGKSCSIL